MLITSAQTITFFRNKEKAEALANANGGAAEGFIVKPAIGRPGMWVISVHDPDDDMFFLGYL